MALFLAFICPVLTVLLVYFLLKSKGLQVDVDAAQEEVSRLRLERAEMVRALRSELDSVTGEAIRQTQAMAAQLEALKRFECLSDAELKKRVTELQAETEASDLIEAAKAEAARIVAEAVAKAGTVAGSAGGPGPHA